MLPLTKTAVLCLGTLRVACAYPGGSWDSANGRDDDSSFYSVEGFGHKDEAFVFGNSRLNTIAGRDGSFYLYFVERGYGSLGHYSGGGFSYVEILGDGETADGFPTADLVGSSAPPNGVDFRQEYSGDTVTNTAFHSASSLSVSHTLVRHTHACTA
jgi:hypothetical protein